MYVHSVSVSSVACVACCSEQLHGRGGCASRPPLTCSAAPAQLQQASRQHAQTGSSSSSSSSAPVQCTTPALRLKPLTTSPSLSTTSCANILSQQCCRQQRVQQHGKRPAYCHTHSCVRHRMPHFLPFAVLHRIYRVQSPGICVADSSVL